MGVHLPGAERDQFLREVTKKTALPKNLKFLFYRLGSGDLFMIWRQDFSLFHSVSLVTFLYIEYLGYFLVWEWE